MAGRLTQPVHTAMPHRGKMMKPRPAPAPEGSLPPLLRPSWGRVAVIAAHPDDETVGAGGHLPLLPDPVVLTVTDGAPRGSDDIAAAGCADVGEYAALRRRELADAMALAGIPAARLECFGIGDQQAARNMARLALRLAEWLGERQVGLVLTHPYEMGHPDHDAVALAVHAAAALLARAGRTPPRVVEFTSYHRGPDDRFIEGVFAPGHPPGEAFQLPKVASTLKRRMIGAFPSQSRVLSGFRVESERFRTAPVYDFTAPPHGQGAYYDMFGWGLRSDEWAVLVKEALDTLGISPC